MKILTFSKKQILLSIRAALLAAFLAALPAHAQFVVNGQAPANQVNFVSAPGSANSVSAAGTFSGYFHDTGLGSDTVVIAPTATISSRLPVIEFGLTSGSGGGSFMNQGSIAQTSGSTYSPLAVAVNVGTTSSGLKISNQGSITAGVASASNSGNYEGSGLMAKATGTGAITIDNAGSISATGEAATHSISASGRGGFVSVVNQGSVTGTTSGVYSFAIGIMATNQYGNISINNSKTVSCSGYQGSAVYAYIAGGTAGDTAVRNSGKVSMSTQSLYGSGTGINVTAPGYIGLVNTGTIEGSAPLSTGFLAHAAGGVYVLNQGVINQTGEDTSAGINLGSALGVDVSAGTKVEVLNRSAITLTASGIYSEAFGVRAKSSGGSVSIGNTDTISAAVAGVEVSNSTGMCAETAGGAITVENRGQLTASGGLVYGIDAEVSGAPTVVEPTRVINAGKIDVSGYADIEGIVVNSGPAPATVTNGFAGTIQVQGGSTAIGIAIHSSASTAIINEGLIVSSGSGIVALGAGDIVVTNRKGSISAGTNAPAIQLGTGRNTVNIIGDCDIIGVIDGGSTHLNNTLTFHPATITTQQQQDFSAVSAEAASDPTGTYEVTLGTKTYSFTDFNSVILQ